MYPCDGHYLLPKGTPSLSLQDKYVKPETSYILGPLQHDGVAVVRVPPARCLLNSMDHTLVDRIHRPLLKIAKMPLSKCPTDNCCTKQFSGAACKVRACLPSIQTPSNAADLGCTIKSHRKNDNCFLIQSRSASRCWKSQRCLSNAQICERKYNLSMSQMETLNIPRSEYTGKEMSKVTQDQQIKSSFKKRDFDPHPYDDTASRNVYLNSKSSLLQKSPWNNLASSSLEITKVPDQQLITKRKKRKPRKRQRCRNRSESDEAFLDNGKASILRNYSVEQLMNILTALSLDQAPRSPLETRQQKHRQTAADDTALVPWKNEPAAKFSGLCEWIGRSHNGNKRHQSLTPGLAKGPKRRVRKRRRSRLLQIRGHGKSHI